MPTTPALLILALGLAASASAAQQSASAPCNSWEDCRDQAVAARTAGDVERFHDLAWRAVQRGPRNDVALMTLLARAQSVSGRPHDALVMLERLLQLGVVVQDVGEGEDFRRVRALPGWPDLQARMEAAPPSPSPAAPAIPPEKRVPAAEPGAPTPAPAKAAPAAKPDAPAIGEAADALRFTAAPFEIRGLAYDAVSKRFIVGNRDDHKLAVIGETSTRLLTLAGADAAGFGEIDALALDPRQGDLWVGSAGRTGNGSALHKLQLISGRLLLQVPVPPEGGGPRLADMAIAGDGTVLALAAATGRLFVLPQGELRLDPSAAIQLDGALTVTASNGRAGYAAGSAGLVFFDLEARTSGPVQAGRGVDLSGLHWIRWDRGAIVAVQRAADGSHRIVRIRLAPGGRTASRLDVLEKDVAIVSPSAMTVGAGGVVYLARGTARDGEQEFVVRRLRLR